MDGLEQLGWKKKETDTQKEYTYTYEIVDSEVHKETTRIRIKRNGFIEITDTNSCAVLKQQELLALVEVIKGE